MQLGFLKGGSIESPESGSPQLLSNFQCFNEHFMQNNGTKESYSYIETDRRIKISVCDSYSTGMGVHEFTDTNRITKHSTHQSHSSIKSHTT